MGSKKTTTAAAGLPALKIGSRVRRTDDLAEGRIVWANGVSVRIAWDEGEHVTWRRVSMAERPIEILGVDKDQATAPTRAAPTEPPQEKQQRKAEAPEATAPEQESPTPEAKPAAETPSTAAEPTPRTAEAAAASEPVPTASKPKRRRKTSTEPPEKRLSAIDAAAKVPADAHADDVPGTDRRDGGQGILDLARR